MLGRESEEVIVPRMDGQHKPAGGKGLYFNHASNGGKREGMPERDNYPEDKVRQLQRKLYRAAKESPNRRFHALYDRIWRWDVLKKAWKAVRQNRGAAGVDRQTLADIEAMGEEVFLKDIQTVLREGRYRPAPVRRVTIPKPDGRVRPLGIPTVRDRVVQMATKIVIEPLFEADFHAVSYGFRPKRSAHQALERIRQVMNQRYTWVLDLDIEAYFDSIDHGLLMKQVERRICDQRVLKLIRKWLKAGVMEEGKVRVPDLGTPQGGVISPLLANIHLHDLDDLWVRRCGDVGILIRYADDMLVLCRSQRAVREAQRRMTIALERLKLKMHSEKSRVMNTARGRDGFDFLGFHHRMVQSWRWRGRWYSQKWPSARAMKKVRQRIRYITGPRRKLPEGVKPVVGELNPMLRGWLNYFRVGNSSRKLSQVRYYCLERLALLDSKRRGWSGRRLKVHDSAWLDSLGLVPFQVRWYCKGT